VTANRLLTAGATFVVGAIAVWALLTFFPADKTAQLPDGPAAAPTSTGAAPAAQDAAPPDGRKIKARLYYVGEQGTRLVGVDQDVAFADDTARQAREIIVAQVAAAPEGRLSPIPPGTGVRAVFVTPKGEAYVDLTRAVADAHPGGTTNEILTVYALVNALTTNLPAVSSVQILIDGHEVDTLAGHVDLRRPLGQNLDWVQ
jgi:hypothetical protein